MRHGLFVGLLAGLVVLGAGAMPAGAYDDEGRPARGRDRVDEVLGRYNLQPAFEKLGRGISNTFGGPLEIPLGVEQRYSKSDVGGSMLTGIVVGTFKAFVRTGVGLYETLTFFLPYPENYAPILPTLAYFKRDTERRPLPLE
ncbi:MAG: exosortase system-associated protein, TIGR04073 family [Candidatus Omnitrophica bacterium]|nr:exosortase system-associated protein, TIGR04073 family [Candidatus Omnitrophota bacterium]